MTPVDLPRYNATSCCLINFWSYNFRRHKTLTVLCPVILVAGGELFFVDHECHQGRWQQQGSVMAKGISYEPVMSKRYPTSKTPKAPPICRNE